MGSSTVVAQPPAGWRICSAQRLCLRMRVEAEGQRRADVEQQQARASPASGPAPRWHSASRPSRAPGSAAYPAWASSTNDGFGDRFRRSPAPSHAQADRRSYLSRVGNSAGEGRTAPAIPGACCGRQYKVTIPPSMRMRQTSVSPAMQRQVDFTQPLGRADSPTAAAKSISRKTRHRSLNELRQIAGRTMIRPVLWFSRLVIATQACDQDETRSRHRHHRAGVVASPLRMLLRKPGRFEVKGTDCGWRMNR